MKKILLSIAMFLAVGTISAFADSATVNPRVLTAFNKDFNAPKAVVWTTGADYFKAAFSFNGNHVFAYYSTEGELLGLTRYVSSLNLPMNLQRSLKENYSDYWISDLFEFSNDLGTSYFITLENADTKIVMKASADGDWKNYDKTRKE